MSPLDLEMRDRPLLERIVARFLAGKNAMLLLVAALALGATAIFTTPREEEPQIVVPLADVFVEAPGYSVDEVERLVATPLERLFWQLDGVEYVYSMSQRDRTVVTVRFYVGEDREDSLIKLRNRIAQNIDLLPPMARSWVAKPIEIDDVPIVTFALYGDGYDEYALRRLGEEFKARLDLLPKLSRTELVGGTPRQILVEADRERLQGRGLTLPEVAAAIRAADHTTFIGDFDQLDHRLHLSAGDGLSDLEQIGGLVVASRDGLPVRLRDVAEVRNQPREPSHYTRIGFGPAAGPAAGTSGAAVTIAVAKQKGADATQVARAVHAEAERLRSEVLPDGVELVVTRDYGETADRKVNDLLKSIGFALASVVVLLLFTLGWREALVVALAVPMSFALALLVNELLGYTINRVTLFALILSLGLVVDDPITNVDNIQRHIRRKDRSARDAVLRGVAEVLPPVIMSTLTIIVSFLPMSFITGMMGPYMAPMAANVPLAVTFSTLAALSVVPWLAYMLLKHLGRQEGETAADGGPVEEVDPTSPLLRRFYRWAVAPWVKSKARAWALLGLVVLLFAGSMSLAGLGLVPLKMLPFDNKNELQVMIDLPEGSTLERTDAAVRAFEDFLAQQPEVTDFESFVGVPSPMDFNGLVRHTYLRRSPELADIRVNLLPKEQREMQSHAIALRLRDDLERIAAEQGAVMRLVEVPPGPPVLATVVAEVYGDDGTPYDQLVASAEQVRGLMEEERGLTDLDVMAAAPHQRLHYSLDRLQAGLHGVEETQVSELLATAVTGQVSGTLRVPGERQPLPIEVRLPRTQRSGGAELGALAARSAGGSMIALEEIGSFEEVAADATVYHKNLRPVVYVTGEMAGRPPAEAILSLQSKLADQPLAEGVEVEWAGEGEWEVTVRVFRDLGLAFGAAMLFIYLLLVVETGSLVMPLLVMMAIPLTAIGIMPGFWLLNHFFAVEVGGHLDSIYFTATAMIGMIALGGIVVRNSLVLIEFISEARAAGASLREAIYESGAVRMRPILLTAGTTALGAWPITLDPIFSGLAWALIFGLVASTFFSLVVVPATYFLLETGSDID